MRSRASGSYGVGGLPALRLAFLVSFAVLHLSGCREDQGVVPTVPSPPFEGITSTDGSGNTLSIDSADWRPVPTIGTTVNPAFPNPCSSTFNLLFRMQATDSIEVTLNPSATTVWEVLASGVYGQGQHQVIGHVETFPPAIYRVYFKIFRNGNTYATYGDVQVSR